MIKAHLSWDYTPYSNLLISSCLSQINTCLHSTKLWKFVLIANKKIDSRNQYEMINFTAYQPPTTQRPVPIPPTIQVIVSSPVLQIVDVGNTVRLSCSGFHVIKKIPITVRWVKKEGRLPDRAYEDHGTLVIANVQYDDSGIYTCRAHVGDEVAEEDVTVTVGGT